VTGPVLIGVGANLPSRFGAPLETCEAALNALAMRGLPVVRRSAWYRSAPVPMSDQPWYVNGVAELGGTPAPERILSILQGVERDLGRRRRRPNEARVIDLDLLAMGALVRDEPPVLPHPRMHLRAFVLLPLRELEPGWRHPVLGEGIEALIARVDPEQRVERIARGLP
jgi:2-amino-4-hydroxy-6-hydroxymethyldihydropteridine diphosphokinase